MIDREPSVKEMAVLWNICAKFVEDNKISCEETIAQTIIENAYKLLKDICDEVGYCENEDEE